MTAPVPELRLAERAMNHLTDVVNSLDETDLDRPTPCEVWSVRDLLAHVAGTATALAVFARSGRRRLPDRPVPLADPLEDTLASVADIRAALTEGSGDPVDVGRAAGDAAIEFTTHAWDLDSSRALPDDLAADVLDLVSPLLTDDLRQQFFAPRAEVGPGATVSDRLVAFLGRDPARFSPSRRREPAAGLLPTSAD